MRLAGRSICRGVVEGDLVLLDSPFSFLGGVEPSSGRLTSTSGAAGTSISGKIFGFPRGRGSTVGSYTMLQMKREGTLPLAIINERAETIVATGAVMAGLPMVDSIDMSLLKNGDRLKVNADTGEIEVDAVKESEVVTCVLMHEGKLLALKRSMKVSTNQGMWAGVSGYIESGDRPFDTAIKEIKEEVAIEHPRLIRSAPMYSIRTGDRLWRIHPFLFESPTDEVTIDWEHTEYRWIEPQEAESMLIVPGFVHVLKALL